jgi:predicted transcriptional regulator
MDQEIQYIENKRHVLELLSKVAKPMTTDEINVLVKITRQELLSVLFSLLVENEVECQKRGWYKLSKKL